MNGWFGPGIAAGVAIFVWGAFSHMALPLGDIGMKPLPDEAALLKALAGSIKTPGVYFFPGSDAATDMEKISQAYATNPHGLMAFSPSDGKPYSMGPPLTIQFAIDVVCGILLAWLMWQAWGSLTGFGSKVFFAVVVGFLAGFALAAPYWNWYGFGGVFFAGQLIDTILGFGAGGLVVAWLMRR